MALVNVFVGMSFLCGGISIGCLILDEFGGYKNGKTLAVDSASCCGIFGALALVGLLFV